ncbi:MAG: sporulation protein YtxC [Halanaerobiales bacterium]
MGITISTLDYPEEIKRKLSDQLGTGIIYAEKESKDYTLFTIDFDQKKNFNTLEYLSTMIADIVIGHLEKKFINRIIKHKYNQFSVDEQGIIQEMTVDHLNESLTPDKKLGEILRREEVIRQILSYFNQNQDLNIEGFFRFRLKDYIDELKIAVEIAVDDFIIEKEYNEFIDLLRYFVNLQEPRISEANVIQNKNGSFKILDKIGNTINNEYLEGYLAEMFEDEVEHEDLLVSALINVAPVKIILHFDQPTIEDTVRKIFDARVDVCDGCKICCKTPNTMSDNKDD